MELSRQQHHLWPDLRYLHRTDPDRGKFHSRRTHTFSLSDTQGMLPRHKCTLGIYQYTYKYLLQLHRRHKKISFGNYHISGTLPRAFQVFLHLVSQQFWEKGIIFQFWKKKKKPRRRKVKYFVQDHMPRKWQLVPDPDLPAHSHVIILLSSICVHNRLIHTNRYPSPLHTQNPHRK